MVMGGGELHVHPAVRDVRRRLTRADTHRRRPRRPAVVRATVKQPRRLTAAATLRRQQVQLAGGIGVNVKARHARGAGVGVSHGSRRRRRDGGRREADDDDPQDESQLRHFKSHSTSR
jgi:hypothetical protein